MKRKYGSSIKEILDYKQEIEEEISRIENLDGYLEQLKYEENTIKKKLDLLANEIHNIRIQKAKELSLQINQNLQDLEMMNAKINIRIDYKENEYFENGKDRVEFFISTNLGEDEKQLIKIASGGEMSRIMLAIKTVIANTDQMPILVFDEIDTGISGKAANKVAEKLNRISDKHQVICISHLPSIAAMADYNYFINKDVISNRTVTSIKQLEEDEIIHEIARISSGEINEMSLGYAKELRQKKIAS